MKRFSIIFVMLILVLASVLASDVVPQDSMAGIMERILKADEDLVKYLHQYDTTMASAQKRMNDELSAELAAIDSRPFTDEDLDKDGNPKKKALEARNKEREEAKERLQMTLDNAIETIQAKFGPEISSSYDLLCSLIDEINKTEFILSTADGNLEVQFDAYLEDEHGWMFSVYPEDFGVAIVHGSFLGFNDISKKSYKRFKEEALQEALSAYEQELKDMGPESIYSMTANVSAGFDKDTGVLSFFVKKLVFSDSSRKKGKVELEFPENSEQVFYETYEPFDMNNYTFALSKSQAKAFKKETSGKKTSKVMDEIGGFVSSIEFYALTNGRIGAAYIPEEKRTTESPVGFIFNGGVDAFLRFGRVIVGVNPHYGMALDNTVLDIYYTVGFDLYGKGEPGADLGCLILRYGRTGGNRFEIGFREFYPREPDKVLDLASGFEAGLILSPEFGYMPGLYLSFAIGGGLGFKK